MRKLFWGLLLIAPLVFGQASPTFTWTPPISYEDGTPLPDAEIASYNIYCNGSLLANVPNTSNTDTYASGQLAVGDYVCNASTVATNGEESGLSNTANFTVDPLVPGAPTGFSVTFP